MKPFLLSLASTADAVAILSTCTCHGLPTENYPDKAASPTLLDPVTAATGAVGRNTIYFVKLKQPLW